MLAGIIAITFINIDFTVCTLKAWITFAGIGANLEKKIYKLVVINAEGQYSIA